MPGHPLQPNRPDPSGGCRRCSTCGINYPVMLIVCRGCGDETDFISNDKPHEDWGDRAAEIRGERGEDSEHGPIPKIAGAVCVFGSELFIAVDDVEESGYYMPLGVFDIIQVGHQFFEVMGTHPGRKAYWIRSFSMTPDEADMAWLAGEGHAET